ncbi:MAG: class I SAM-dependent methyltransferase [Bacteroidetes bacterium]|nr:class I SAM-dependent methyltransferase [Bacteroidota bacterium]
MNFDFGLIKVDSKIIKSNFYYLRRIILSTLDKFWNFFPRDRIIKHEQLKYNRYYRKYQHLTRVGFDHAIKKVVGYIEFQTVLDVGCGSGFSLREFIRLGYDAKGTDISDWLIKHELNDLYKQGKVFCAPAEKLPFPDNSFDLVFCTDVLEHIPTKNVAAAISELVRVSKKNIFCTISLHSSSKNNVIEYHSTIQPRKYWESIFESSKARCDYEIFKKVQGTEKTKVGGKIVDVEYFIYDKN